MEKMFSEEEITSIKEGILEEVKKAAGRDSEINALNLDSARAMKLNDIGIDSLALVSLSMDIESKFDIKISDSDFEGNFINIDTMAELVMKKMNES